FVHRSFSFNFQILKRFQSHISLHIGTILQLLSNQLLSNYYPLTKLGSHIAMPGIYVMRSNTTTMTQKKGISLFVVASMLTLPIALPTKSTVPTGEVTNSIPILRIITIPK